MKRWLWGIAALIFLVIPAVRWLAPVFIVNPSPSLPPGLYVRAVPGHSIEVGDFIVLETPEVLKPSLPPGYEDKSLLKQVAGVAGMQVCWTGEAMVVGRKHRTPGWYPYHPGQTTRYQEGCQRLGPDEMLITGRHAKSFDSRYTGPVSTRLVRFRVWPLWTKES